uniref:HEAT repeat domain-containing protein n=1 Tax=candidate division WOR-3 bacterium TaxID=2052148 RepID=A0A7C6EHX2_UNCW3
MRKYQRNIILLFSIILASCGMPPKDKALSILKEGIKDKSEIIKVNAAKALIETGDKNGYEVIYNILQNGSNDARVSALVALYSLKERVYSPVIVKLCNDSEPLVRAEAYHLISLSSDTGYYKILTQGTGDRIARIRRYSYQGLVNFKDIQGITRGLRDIDPLVRISAAKSLGLLGKQEAKDFIKKEMDPKNPNVEIWAQAVLALGELKDTSAIQYIKDLLTDTPWDLKIAAAEALLMLKDNSGVDVLKSSLQAADPFARVKAVEVMERFPLPEFYDLLKQASKDEYINVSISAINALVKYQKKENLKLFEGLLSAPNPLVRITSAGAYLRSL